jgi:bifunctional DNase/RNase
MPVEMELSRILIRELNDYQLIELTEVEGDRSFPIVIGLPEAQAIERRLQGKEIKRPQTHDLLSALIDALGGRLISITINDLSDHTFFATLDIQREDGETLHIDSRPSDAIAIGIAGGVPIYVEEHVLEEAQSEEV